MKVVLAEIAELVGGRIAGNPETLITGLAGVREAKPGELTFVAQSDYVPLLETSGASAAVVCPGVGTERMALVYVEDPDRAFADIAQAFFAVPVRLEVGVHPSAVVAADAVLGKDVVVSANVVIRPGARVGDRTVLYPGVYVGDDASIGSDCTVYANCVLRERVVVGDRCVLHPGVVVGSDGFGYLSSRTGHRKIPQIGNVLIGDDVEIGANTCIDRARVGSTVIGAGTKIDNLVQIGHNVHVGGNCLIVSQAGLAGSCRLGDNCVLGGQAGLREHVVVGAGVHVAGRAGVTKSIPGPGSVSGLPAQDHRSELRLQAALRRVPALLTAVRQLTERIVRLEAQAKNHRS